MAGRVTLEVYTEADGWQPYPADADPGDGSFVLRPDVSGVRARIARLDPTESFTLRVGMIARVPLPPGDVPASLTNCYAVSGVTANGTPDEYATETYCSPPLVPGEISEAAAINKSIAPETMPKPIPGMTPEQATVTLQIRNTGTITARTLQLTDNDLGDVGPSDFWDAVDFVGIASIQAPSTGALARADRVRIDAFVDPDGAGPTPGSWVNGTPAPPASATVPVPASQVRGLRVTFSDTSTLNDGFVITPCPGADQTCAGIVRFQVQPRLTLLSTGEPIEDVDPCPNPAASDTVCVPLLNSATGAFTTRLNPDPDDPAVIDEVAGDGAPVTLTDDEGEPVLLPLGTRCWADEQEPAGATGVSIEHDSFETGAEVVVADELQTLQLTVTNTFDAARLAITKQAVDAPRADATFTITVTCTVTDASGATVEVPLLSGSSPLTIRSGQTVEVTTLAGARCAVAEPNPGGATVSFAETGGTDGDATDGVVTLTGDRAVVVTNRFPTGQLPSTGRDGTRAVLALAGLLVLAGVVLLGGRGVRTRRSG